MIEKNSNGFIGHEQIPIEKNIIIKNRDGSEATTQVVAVVKGASLRIEAVVAADEELAALRASLLQRRRSPRESTPAREEPRGGARPPSSSARA